MSQKQIDTMLPLAKQYPEFRVAMDKWTAFNNRLLDVAEKAGLINAEQRAIWQKDDYVPFYRLDDDMLEGRVKGGGKGPGGIEGQRSGIRKLTGSDMKANDIIENMVLNMASLVDRSYRERGDAEGVAIDAGHWNDPRGADGLAAGEGQTGGSGSKAQGYWGGRRDPFAGGERAGAQLLPDAGPVGSEGGFGDDRRQAGMGDRR